MQSSSKATRRHSSRKSKKADFDSQIDFPAAFFDLVPDLVCVASTDGYFKRVNAAWQAILGYTSDELLARPVADFIHPDDIKPTIAQIARQLSGQRTEGFINRYQCKDGTYKWLEWNSFPAQGPLLYAAARDVTAQQQFEQKLINERQQLFEVLDSLPVLICLLTKDYHVAFANRRFRDKFGESGGRHSY